MLKKNDSARLNRGRAFHYGRRDNRLLTSKVNWISF